MLDTHQYNSLSRGSSWVRERRAMFGFLCKSHGFRFTAKYSLPSKHKIHAHMKTSKLQQFI